MNTSATFPTPHADAPLLPAGWYDGSAVTAAGRFSYETDLVNLTLAYQAIDNRLFSIHYYAGVNISSLKNKEHVAYFIATGWGYDFGNFSYERNFMKGNAFVDKSASTVGVVPLVGMHAVYKVTPPFSFVSDLGLAFLAGSAVK